MLLDEILKPIQLELTIIFTNSNLDGILLPFSIHRMTAERLRVT